MGALEQIQQMRSQGIEDDEIIQKLQEQGVSPRAINDALNQAQIKQAVSGEEENMEDIPSPSSTPSYIPKTQEVPQNTQQYGDYYSQNYYPQENYSEQPYTGTDTNTIIEIAEQVFMEKVQKIQDKTNELNEFKTISESKINNISERIKRIEAIMDKMQTAILEKIGSYGENLSSIKKEMSMMQDSFGKIVNKIPEKSERHETLKELKKISEHRKKPAHKTKKRK
ncbi:MAG: hypothetical protein ABIH49_01540 [archaeon]